MEWKEAAMDKPQTDRNGRRNRNAAAIAPWGHSGFMAANTYALPLGGGACRTRSPPQRTVSSLGPASRRTDLAGACETRVRSSASLISCARDKVESLSLTSSADGIAFCMRQSYRLVRLSTISGTPFAIFSP